MYPPWYSQISGTARLDQGQPPRSRGPGSSCPLPLQDTDPGNVPDPCTSSRPAQDFPPPQRHKEGQEIGWEREKVTDMRPRDTSLLPRTTAPRCAARRGALPRNLGAVVGRKREREGLGRETKVRGELADPRARHQMILIQLHGLIQRCWMVALSRPVGQLRNELLQYHQIDHSADVTCLGHQPLAASISELLGQYEWPAAVP